MAQPGSAPETGLEQLLPLLWGDVLQALDRASERVRHAFGTQVKAAKVETAAAPETAGSASVPPEPAAAESPESPETFELIAACLDNHLKVFL